MRFCVWREDLPQYRLPYGFSRALTKQRGRKTIWGFGGAYAVKSPKIIFPASVGNGRGGGEEGLNAILRSHFASLNGKEKRRSGFKKHHIMRVNLTILINLLLIRYNPDAGGTPLDASNNCIAGLF
jgi:hypothetical protein